MSKFVTTRNGRQVTWVFLLVIGVLNALSGQAQLRVKEKIIVNVAADAIALYPKWGGDIDVISKKQVVDALNQYIDDYAGSQVTSLFFNANYQRACFDSKVMTPYWDLPEGMKITSWPINHGKLHRKGVDPYEVCIKRAREKKIAPWVSVRMNDHHYWEDSTKINRFLWNNPENRIYAGAFANYGKKEVRDYYMAFIEEVLDKYDIDGIELDWVRTNTLFKDGTVDDWKRTLNAFMKETRAMADRKGKQKGRKFRIAVRVLSSPEISESYGLDGIGWVKNGWADVLIPTNWHTPTHFDIPVDVWKQRIGKGHAYVLAPCAELAYRCVENPYAKTINNDAESMRGFAMMAYSKGADAIYLFNHFNEKDFNRKEVRPDGSGYVVNDRLTILNEVGTFKTASGKARRHVLTYPAPVEKGKTKVSYLPVSLSGSTRSFKLNTGPRPSGGKYIVLVGLNDKPGYDQAQLKVKVNGTEAVPLKDVPKEGSFVYKTDKKWDMVTHLGAVSARMARFQVDASACKDGHNTIEITNPAADEQEVIWLEAWLN